MASTSFFGILLFLASSAGLPQSEVTIAELAQTKGYNTGLIGKYNSNYSVLYMIINSIVNIKRLEGPSRMCSYGSWIYNYLCNQILPPLTFWVRIPLSGGVLDTTLWNIVYQWLSTGWLFSPVSSTNKTDRYDITNILLKVALNTIIQTLLNIKGL